MQMQVEEVRIADLLADPANPRTHDDRNMDAIVASLREHGQVEPIVVQRSSMMVIGGNGRVEAMKRLGWEQANAVLLDIEDTAARRLSIALNRTGELAGWDAAVLAQHLDDLVQAGEGFTLADLGFDDEEYARLLDALEYTDAQTGLPLDAFDGGPQGGGGAGGFQAERPTQAYVESNVKKFEIYCEQGQFDDVVAHLAHARAAFGVSTNSEAVLALLAHFARTGTAP